MTGVATIPLLLAKLWTVWPKLFSWPPVAQSGSCTRTAELGPLVGGSLFLLFTGVANIAYWYSPMPFFFPTAHFWTAWIVVGALVIHIGSKSVVARSALARGSADREGATAATEHRPGTDEAGARAPGRLPGRAFAPGIRGHRHGAGAAVLVLTVAGETVAPLRRLALLAPRNPVVGPQDVPVNQSAIEAGVTTSAVDPAYRLDVSGNCRTPRTFTVADLALLAPTCGRAADHLRRGLERRRLWRGISLPYAARPCGRAAPGSGPGGVARVV